MANVLTLWHLGSKDLIYPDSWALILTIKTNIWKNVFLQERVKYKTYLKDADYSWVFAVSPYKQYFGEKEKERSDLKFLSTSKTSIERSPRDNRIVYVD